MFSPRIEHSNSELDWENSISTIHQRSISDCIFPEAQNSNDLSIQAGMDELHQIFKLPLTNQLDNQILFKPILDSSLNNPKNEDYIIKNASNEKHLQKENPIVDKQNLWQDRKSVV